MAGWPGSPGGGWEVVGNAQVLHMDSFPVRTQRATPGLTVLKFCSRWKEQVSHSRRQAV